VRGALMSGPESTVMGGGGGFDLDSNFERIQINFKSLQTLTGPKGTLPRSKNLKQNIAVKVLKKGTSLSIGTSPDSKYISNENSEKFLGLEFNRIS
jgi:hypothetical protein